MRSLTVIGLGLGLGLGGCNGTAAQVKREQQAFVCRDRSISYVAAHHMGADELGVQMDCANGPSIKRWKMDRQGHRTDDARALTPGEFDAVWNQIDGTGWANLRDCTNGSTGKEDPVYTFDVKDDQNKASFSCQSRAMPYPYNDLVDPLDQAAAQGKGQLGDDEPAEAKALDTKSKKHP